MIVQKIELANPTADEAEGVIRALLKECVEGVSDREAQALELAVQWGIAEDWVTKGFAKARADRARAEVEARAAPKVEQPIKRRKVPSAAAKPEGGVGEDSGGAGGEGSPFLR
jgi:hypothetical protein